MGLTTRLLLLERLDNGPGGRVPTLKEVSKFLNNLELDYAGVKAGIFDLEESEKYEPWEEKKS